MLEKNINQFIHDNNLDFFIGTSIKHILDYNESGNKINLEKAILYLEEKLSLLDNTISSKNTIKLKNIDFYYINLDHRNDRRIHIESELSKINLTAKRFKAFDRLDNCNINFGEKFNDGQKKCYLSHYTLIKNYDINSKKILGIFEDDVLFCEDFLKRFEYIEKEFNYDWDIFYLSSFYHLNNDNKRWHHHGDFEKTNTKYIHRVYGSFCCHSYLINPKSIQKIINLLDSVVFNSYAIDHALILIQPNLNCYSFTPGMTTQLTNQSDTDGGIRNQNQFESILGQHYYINNINDFNYDEYFK